MREQQPSVTAMFVAFARAVGNVDPRLSPACRDERAAELCPGALRFLLATAEHSAHPNLAFSALRLLSLGMVEHLALRTAVIDDALRAGIGRGAKQFVVLGAGLDSRAHRLPELADCVAFEVDFPSTQALKRKKAQDLPVIARELRYAPCDFERVSLAQSLAEAGFDPKLPTVWIWEGVTMYLFEKAVFGTLSALEHLSAPRSTLITTYVTPELTQKRKWVGQLGNAALSLLAEPMHFFASPERIEHMLREHGFSLVRDVLPEQQAAHFGAQISKFSLVLPNERVAVAVRVP